jgi:hypothetical protein
LSLIRDNRSLFGIWKLEKTLVEGVLSKSY